MSTTRPTDYTGWNEETSRLFIDLGRFIVPQRDRQMEIIAALLSDLDGPCTILELCCGEGLLAGVLLDRYPMSRVHGLDGSAEMLQQAQERLARFGDRFRCGRFDLASREWRETAFPVDAIVSSLAIHHLTGPEKLALFQDVQRMLVTGGLLVIADIVEHKTQAGQRSAAEEWDEAVRQQSLDLAGNTDAFDYFDTQGWNMFRYLDPDDIDKPSPLLDQLKWLEAAGFVAVDVHWMLAGHAVFGARKR